MAERPTAPPDEGRAEAREAAAEVARALVAGLRAQVPSEGFALAGIEVEVGELVDVDRETLAEALRTALPGVEVRLTVVPAVLVCLDCGAEYPADEHPCPSCGSSRAELLRGNELQVLRAWGAPT